jgi:Glycosyltransferases involved in cell wall biogenesis
MTAEVTIILPFYNAGEFFSETLASVTEQTYDRWHLILVDDGSTDESPEIARKFKERHPDQVSLLISGGVGAARARNIATDIADTRYIAFLDADDIWHPEKLATQLAAMKESGAVFSYTAFRKVTPNAIKGSRIFFVPDTITRSELLKSCPIRCFTVIYDQIALGKLHMPDVKMRNDYLTWFDALERIETLSAPNHTSRPILGINVDLGFYRIHPSSLTGNKFRAARYQWQAYRENLHLPFHQAAYYFAFYAMSGIINRKRF